MVYPTSSGASSHDLVVFNSTVIVNHHLRHLRRHDRCFQICARKSGDIIQRMPLRDDQEFYAVTERTGEDRRGEKTLDCPQRRESIGTKVLYVVPRLAWPSQTKPLPR